MENTPENILKQYAGILEEKNQENELTKNQMQSKINDLEEEVTRLTGELGICRESLIKLETGKTTG